MTIRPIELDDRQHVRDGLASQYVDEVIPSRPMTVLVLRSVDGTGGGAESIILRTARQLDQSQARLVICAFRRSNDTTYDFDRRVAATGCSYHEILQHSPFDRNVWPQVVRAFERHKPDLLEAHDYKASYFARCLSKVYRVPAIATLHGWSGHKLREKYLYYPFDKLNVRRFPALVTVSSEIRNTIIRWGASPSSVCFIPNGIDADAFDRCPEVRLRKRRELAIPPQQVVIGSAGRLVKEKRFDVLIEAIASLRRRNLPVLLLIAGEGSLEQSLVARISQRGLVADCKLLGHRRDMAELYSAFDIYAQSSDNEGTPGVLVEAMACRLPIVATNVGGTSDLLEHGESALLVPRRSPDLLARSIERLIQDPTLAQRLAESARLRAQTHFSFAHRTARLLRLYNSLANVPSE